MTSKNGANKNGAIEICLLYPDLLGTYGDGGNAVVLSQRLTWRGITNRVVEVSMGDPIPDQCDIYLLGGGEDQPQTLVTDYLNESKALHRGVERGAVVLAVCAGMQVIGESFAIAGGKTKAGLGLLDITTVRGEGERCVGELIVSTSPANEFGTERLTGYENHGGATHLGKDACPLGTVVHGRGNDDGKRTEGAVQGRIVGTYLHGPFLARNGHFADYLLSWATSSELAPIDDAEVNALREERFEAVTNSKKSRLSRLMTR